MSDSSPFRYPSAQERGVGAFVGLGDGAPLGWGTTATGMRHWLKYGFWLKHSPAPEQHSVTPLYAPPPHCSPFWTHKAVGLSVGDDVGLVVGILLGPCVGTLVGENVTQIPFPFPSWQIPPLQSLSMAQLCPIAHAAQFGPPQSRPVSSPL
jgi:hypothetical protein